MKLGKMYEARILVEASGGNGSVDFTKATLVVGDVTSVSPVPEISRGRSASWGSGKGTGVLSLVSLTGTVIRSVPQNGSEQAKISTDNLAKGVYVLQFKGDGKAPVIRTLLLK